MCGHVYTPDSFPFYVHLRVGLNGTKKREKRERERARSYSESHFLILSTLRKRLVILLLSRGQVISVKRGVKSGLSTDREVMGRWKYHE